MSGRILRDFIADEINLGNDSFEDLKEEIPYFDELNEIILDFLNRKESLEPGETKYYVLCSLCRTQTIKACTNMMRWHVSDAFSATRLATDAALYALLMMLGRLSEDEYLSSRKARDDAVRQLGADIQKGVKVPPIVLAVRQVRTDHSPHAHADPITLANRMIEREGGQYQYSAFQSIDDPQQFRYYFMGMLWVGGMCFRAFLEVQQEVFGEDVSLYVERLMAWKLSLFEHRRSLEIFPDSPLEDGF